MLVVAALSPIDYIREYYGPAIQVTNGTGLFPEVLVIQSAFETGWGKSSHAEAPVYNLFGIKADASWQGRVVSSTTSEFENGGWKSYEGTGKVYNNRASALQDGAHKQTLFRVYNSLADSMRNWVKFLQENPRYTTAGVFRAKSPAEQFAALKAGGYATGPKYAEILTDIYNDNYNRFLTVLDELSDTVQDNSGSIAGLVFGTLILFGIAKLVTRDEN